MFFCEETASSCIFNTINPVLPYEAIFERLLSGICQRAGGCIAKILLIYRNYFSYLTLPFGS